MTDRQTIVFGSVIIWYTTGWAMTGPLLGRCWASIGPILGQTISAMNSQIISIRYFHSK